MANSKHRQWTVRDQFPDMRAASPQDFIDAVGGDGPLAYTWLDKPHRLVYELVSRIRLLEEKAKKEWQDAASHITS
jgi:hypothetical protein